MSKKSFKNEFNKKNLSVAIMSILYVVIHISFLHNLAECTDVE